MTPTPSPPVSPMVAMAHIPVRRNLILQTFACITLVLLCLTCPAIAQATTNATCTSGHEHLFNALGQSPCLVMAFLAAPCNAGVYNVRPLPEGYRYSNSESRANRCRCNTVFYSMMAACSFCQNRNFRKWSKWRTNCTAVVESNYPVTIPLDTSVPSWAYENILMTDSWNPDSARRNIGPDSSAPPLPTSSDSPNPTGNEQSNSATVGIAVGGVIGGVVFFVVAIALAYALCKGHITTVQLCGNSLC